MYLCRVYELTPQIMKRFGITLLFALCCLYNVFAYDFSVNGIFYNKISSKEVSVTYKSTSNRGYSGIVNIPNEVEYRGVLYSVTSIGDFAFRYCSGLTGVTIPNNVTTIGNQAFFWFIRQMHR